MPPSTDCSARLENERGAVLLILVIVFMTCFTLFGVALDTGNLYHSSMLLQKAIDAGALAAAKKIAITGKQVQYRDPNRFIAEIERTAKSMINMNMAIRRQKSDFGDNNPGDPLRYTIKVDLVQDTVEIEALWTVRLLLLTYLPTFADQASIKMSTKSQVQRSMVSLLLDTSGSMMCPADGSDCGCAPLCHGLRKVDRLKEAVANFAVQFNAGRDLLHIGYFSLGAMTALKMVPEGGFNLKQVQDALQNMFLQGATNQCAALVDGWVNTRDAVKKQGDRKNIAFVLFSDGAPTAARFSFASPTQLPENNVLNLPGSQYDYMNWAVDFRDPADPAGLDEKPQLPLIPGPMMLAESDLVPYEWDLGNPPPNTTPACSQKDPLDKNAPFASCMSSFGFRVPWDETGKVWGDGFKFPEYRKQYYNCVIAHADSIRDEGAVVYTVGVGAGASSSTDPYQNASEDSLRKDYFFERVANDPAYKESPHFPGEFDHYEPPTKASHLSQGRYLYLSNALTLEQTFLELYDAIVRKVKTVQLVK